MPLTNHNHFLPWDKVGTAATVISIDTLSFNTTNQNNLVPWDKKYVPGIFQRIIHV